MQRRLGSDIAMCLDVCPSRRRSAAELERAVERRRVGATPARRPRLRASCASGSCRAASIPSSERRSIAEITSLPFDGFALGGLAVGEIESRDVRLPSSWAAPLLPSARPRYFMGIGDPEGILEVIAAGIDMFDCVLPTRTARTGSALTWEGRLNLRNAASHAIRGRSTRTANALHASGFRAVYIRHLVTQDELLGLRLLSLHNLRFVLDLTARARAAIEQGAFSSFRNEALARLAAPPEEEPCNS